MNHVKKAYENLGSTKTHNIWLQMKTNSFTFSSLPKKPTKHQQALYII